MKTTVNKLISTAKRWGSLVIAAAFVGCILWFGGVINQAAPAIETDLKKRMMPVTTIFAKSNESYRIERSYLGQVESERQSLLSFEVSGKLLSVHVDEGEIVKKGQLLADLDTQILVSQRDSLVAQVTAAKSKLDELVKGPRSEVINAAKANVDNWLAQRKLATARKRRLERLIATNAISRQEYDDARFGEQSAEAQLTVAQARLEELNNGTRQEQITSQKAAWQRLLADQNTIETQIHKSKLFAPFDGTVSSRILDEGAVIQSGQGVLEIFDHKNMEARFGLPVRSLQRARENSESHLVYQAETVAAKFKTVRPARNPKTRTVDVIYSLKNLPTPAFVGEVVELKLDQEIEERGFWLPADSLIENYRGLWGCFVVHRSTSGENQTAKMLELELLHQDGDRVYVAGAIKPQDQVIISGVHRIVAGQSVVVTSNRVKSSKFAAYQPAPISSRIAQTVGAGK